MMTMKWMRYMQNDTLAMGANIQCPTIYLVGSCLQPNIEAKEHMNTPSKKTTLNHQMFTCLKSYRKPEQ